MPEDYRAIILHRLKVRDRKCAQFSRVFSSYDTLAESFTHLLSNGGRRLLPSESNGEEVENLKTELSDLYKKKATNDQQLIDANIKLIKLEKRLGAVTEERDKALMQVKEMHEKVKKAEADLADYKEANQTLNDEFIALQMLYNGVNEKFIVADQERTDLITRMKEMKEREISLLNEFNDKEQQRQMDKIRSALEEAIRPQLDAKSNSSLPEDHPPGSAAEGAAPSSEFYGDVIPERCILKMEANEVGEINDTIFHPNGRYFFTGGSDKKIRMFEMAGNGCLKKAVLTGANSGITRIDLDSECRHVLGSSNDYAIRIWSVDDQRNRLTFTGHSDKVAAARFLSAGRLVASGSNDRTIKIWDLTSSRCTKTYFPGSIILDMATNDRYGVPVISSHFDKSIRFWDNRTEGPSYMTKLNGKVTSLFVGGDGQSLLCSCRDETLSLIDLRNYGIVHIYSAEQYRTASDYGKCVISPGGTYVAAGSADGHIFIWYTMSTRLEKVLYKNGHDTPVLSLAWHPNGQILISGDKRKMLCMWQ